MARAVFGAAKPSDTVSKRLPSNPHSSERDSMNRRVPRLVRIEPRLIRATRAITGKNERLVAAYLKSEREPKLHIGAGDNDLSGWLNTELCPRGSEVFLDATKPFPFAANTFAFIYSEHMIEHIPYAGAVSMMRECHRVLRPGGVIRIVTPNMAFLKSLLASPPTPEQHAYIRYSLRSATGS